MSEDVRAFVVVFVGALVTAFWWFIRKSFGKIGEHDIRIAVLEGISKANDARHEANLQRLGSIEAKLDRLIERR